MGKEEKQRSRGDANMRNAIVVIVGHRNLSLSSEDGDFLNDHFVPGSSEKGANLRQGLESISH